MTWNTPKPGEWKSEELSKGRIIDYKAFNFVDGEGVRNSSLCIRLHVSLRGLL